MLFKGLPLKFTVVAVGAILSISCGQASNAMTAAQSTVNSDGDLRYKVPEGWITEKPTSSMRAAQYVLPKVEGDPEDASLVLFYFGRGQGGSVEDNMARWIGQ